MSLDLQLSNKIRKRIQGLIENPYAGSKCFPVNMPGAEYSSNCHGTTTYIYGLLQPNERHPIAFSTEAMEKIIEVKFKLSNEFKTGELVGFYSGRDEEKVLLHSAVMINNTQIFHQSGFGGIFEENYLESIKSFYFMSFTHSLDVCSFRRIR